MTKSPPTPNTEAPVAEDKALQVADPSLIVEWKTQPLYCEVNGAASQIVVSRSTTRADAVVLQVTNGQPVLMSAAELQNALTLLTAATP